MLNTTKFLDPVFRKKFTCFNESLENERRRNTQPLRELEGTLSAEKIEILKGMEREINEVALSLLWETEEHCLALQQIKYEKTETAKQEQGKNSRYLTLETNDPTMTIRKKIEGLYRQLAKMIDIAKEGII